MKTDISLRINTTVLTTLTVTYEALPILLLSDFISDYLLVLSTTALMVFLFFKLAKHVYLRAFALTNSNAWVLFPNSYMVSSLTFSGFA